MNTKTYEQREQFWQLAEQHLTPKQWEAVRLRFGFEMRWVDIARHLDISQQAAKERVESGLRRLRRHIEQEAA